MKKFILVLSAIIFSITYVYGKFENISGGTISGIWGCKTVQPFEAYTYQYGEYPTGIKTVDMVHNRITWKIINGKAMDSNGNYSLTTITTDQEEVVVEDLYTFSTIQIKWDSGQKGYVDLYNEAGELIRSGNVNILDFDNPIQNITLSDNRVYNASYINIKNVQILQTANITFNGYNSVIIEPGFTAQAGSKVRIHNQWPTIIANAPKRETDLITIPTAIELPLLNQNIPNPFREETIISLYLPENYHSSFLIIYNVFGKIIKKIEIGKKGKNEFIFNGRELMPGIYTYSLMVDNKLIDSKRFNYIK